MQTQQSELRQSIKKHESENNRLIQELQQKGNIEQELKQQIDKLNADLQAKRQAQIVLASASVNSWHYAPCGRGDNNKRNQIRAAVDQMGLIADWQYIDYIFGRESTHDPACVNHIGCRGLGQACPGSKLPCGPNDITCQLNWFHNYAIDRYGSWAQAYNAWTVKHWW